MRYHILLIMQYNFVNTNYCIVTRVYWNLQTAPVCAGSLLQLYYPGTFDTNLASSFCQFARTESGDTTRHEAHFFCWSRNRANNAMV